MKGFLALCDTLNEQLSGRDWHLAFTTPKRKTSGNHNTGVIHSCAGILRQLGEHLSGKQISTLTIKEEKCDTVSVAYKK